MKILVDFTTHFVPVLQISLDYTVLSYFLPNQYNKNKQYGSEFLALDAQISPGLLAHTRYLG